MHGYRLSWFGMIRVSLVSWVFGVSLVSWVFRVLRFSMPGIGFRF